MKQNDTYALYASSRPTSRAVNIFPFNSLELWEGCDHCKLPIPFTDMYRAPLWAQNEGGFTRKPELREWKREVFRNGLRNASALAHTYIHFPHLCPRCLHFPTISPHFSTISPCSLPNSPPESPVSAHFHPFSLIFLGCRMTKNSFPLRSPYSPNSPNSPEEEIATHRSLTRIR